MTLEQMADMDSKQSTRKFQPETISNAEYASDKDAMIAMFNHAIKSGQSVNAQHMEQQLGQFVRLYLRHAHEVKLEELI